MPYCLNPITLPFPLEISTIVMRQLFSLLLCAASLAAVAQTEVTPYIAGQTAEGITYFLPQTRLRIVLHATRTTYHPGEYAPYAERYLRITDAPQQEYSLWTITGIAVQPYGAADTRRAYSIKLRPKTTAPNVTLARDGRLLGVNSLTPPPAEEQLIKPSKELVSADETNPAAYKTAEILSAGSVPKMAELAAAEIYDIRESRNLLSKGQADYMPQDGEQLKLMLTKLDEQERGLTKLFTGTTSVEKYVLTTDFKPSPDQKNCVFARFSKFLGLVDADDLSGDPLYIYLKPETTIAPNTEAEGLTEVADLRYCVPARVNVQICLGLQKLTELMVPMAQFGRIENLGGELFNRKTTTHIDFSPQTGGILKIATDESR